MNIETTVNLNKDIVEVLSKVSKTAGCSKTSIIVLLLKRLMTDSNRLAKSFLPVKYQEKDPLCNWHKLHIHLNEYEYEYCLDMRKLFKMSVSLLVAYAVGMYLSEIINRLLETDIKKITDNYPPQNYILIREVIDSIICWRIYWGIPYHFKKSVLPMA